MAQPSTTVNERTTLYVTLSFKDKEGAGFTPSSLKYRVDCITSGTVVRQLTDVPGPTQVYELKLIPSDTAIVKAGHRTEDRVLTVIASGPTGDDQITEEVPFTIRNLRYVSA